MQAEIHLRDVHVPMVSRTYRITQVPAGLNFYREFDEDDWHLEGSALGVAPADWKEALKAHVLG